MTDYTARFKPEDFFVKETVAIYSSAIKDLSEPLIKYYAVEALLQNYVFKDELEQIEIIHFIFKNWFLVSTLEEASAQSKNIFGEDTVLALELFSDPEDEKESTELFIIIKPDLSLDESLEKFDQLLAGWFNTVQYKTQGLLNITIESKDEF